MFRSLTSFILVSALAGCASLTPQHLWQRDKPVESKPTTSPISQLGVALPAMKPGDERELNIIAAEQMAANGYWKEAITLYKEAEAMAPKKPKLDAQLAPALAGAGQYNESLQRYRRLIEHDPKNASLVNNFAFTLMESGDLSSAESEYRRALELDPQLENAAVNLGLLLASQRRYEDAMATLTPAIGAAAAHHNMGVVAIDLGDERIAHHHFTLAASYPAVPQATQEFVAALSSPSPTASK